MIEIDEPLRSKSLRNDQIYIAFVIIIIASIFSLLIFLHANIGQFPFIFHKYVSNYPTYQLHAWIGFTILFIWSAQLISGSIARQNNTIKNIHRTVGPYFFIIILIYTSTSAYLTFYWNFVSPEDQKRSFYSVFGVSFVGIVTSIFLLHGFIAIKQRKFLDHKHSMIFAFVALCYVALARFVAISLRLLGLDPSQTEFNIVSKRLDPIEFTELQVFFTTLLGAVLWFIYARRHGIIRTHWAKTISVLIFPATFALALVN
ncbi:DUF2306 domain-containing protein [Roseibium sp. RKSG952]|uniref:DUF2306 domain-containing protein n=1 Tax=Roseibium sp. RKSG952 TaxID=2529384 RepID=UPI0018AD2DA2|nr:DUF2306 domain-containing protein [Roseibium sp. RKSG952]